MDKPISFFVLVIPRDQAARLGDSTGRIWTQEDIEKMGVGFVRLELLPRGKGKLLVRAPQLFSSIKSDGVVDMTVTLFNEGSRRIDNIEVSVDQPLNWKKEIQPSVISSLEIGAEQQVHFRFIPPSDISVGRYDMRLRTSGMSDNQPVNGEDKTITIEIQAGANIFGTILVVLSIVGLVTGMVIFGIKLSRR
jgi:uncharacterized membrane protein